jgi:hypothetical protein
MTGAVKAKPRRTHTSAILDERVHTSASDGYVHRINIRMIEHHYIQLSPEIETKY